MRQRGYNLVMLMIAITVLNIMVAIALPSWTSVIQRDKEEELISRGFQYVEAIRVFQNRFQRLPVRIEELIEVKPRCIRRLWKDPMTDGKFAVIHPDQPQPNGAAPPRVPGQEGNEPAPGEDGQAENPPDTDPGSFGAPPKGEISVGPIIGVRSRSNKKSFLVFTGKEHYDEWRFTLDMMLGGRQAPPQPGQPPPSTPVPGAGMQLSIRWLGRPLPSFLQPQGGGLPGGGDQEQEQPPGESDGKGPAPGGRRPRP